VKKLKIGILICDHINAALKEEFVSYPKMFDELLSQLEGQFKIKYYFVVDNEFPQDINECDAYITSGSQYGANDKLAWIEKLIKFIQDLYQANKCFIGICFGHQLIAKALGGKVEKSDKGWGVGIHSSQLKIKKSWMEKNVNDINLIVSHQDQISQLPESTEVLSSNEFCPYSMIQVGKNFIGLQGHPEFTHKYSLALMEIRKDRIPSDVISNGKLSLKMSTNSKEVTQGLINFVLRHSTK